MVLYDTFIEWLFVCVVVMSQPRKKTTFVIFGLLSFKMFIGIDRSTFFRIYCGMCSITV